MSQTKNRVCNACLMVEDDYSRRVYEYVRRHPGSQIGEIAEQTGVPKDYVLRFVREGALKVANPPQGTCGRCSMDIRELQRPARDAVGIDLCDPCLETLTGQIRRGAGQGSSRPVASNRSSQAPKRYGLGRER